MRAYTKAKQASRDYPKSQSHHLKVLHPIDCRTDRDRTDLRADKDSFFCSHQRTTAIKETRQQLITRN